MAKITIDTTEIPTDAERAMLRAWLAATEGPPPGAWQYELHLHGEEDGVAEYRTGKYEVVGDGVQKPLSEQDMTCVVQWTLPEKVNAPKVVLCQLREKTM